MLTVYKGIVEHGKYLYTYLKSSIAVSSTVCDIPQSCVSKVKMVDGVVANVVVTENSNNAL